MTSKRPTYTRAFDLNSTSRPQRDQIKKSLTDIWREHEGRRTSAFAKTQLFGLSKNEDAKNFLRREVYALGQALKRNAPSWNLSEFIDTIRTHRNTRIREVDGHVFHSLLMGIYEEDSQISRQERWVMARELEYASRHNVPDEFLCGFLFQSGGRKNLLKKIEADFVEPAFRPHSEA